MKKLLALLLAAVLCFALGACGGKTQTDNNGAQQETEQAIQTEISESEQAVAVVNIVINPEFNIHVGNDGNVIAVECLNADAKSVGGKVSVTGKSCKDAIIMILQETVNQGFLKDGGKIEISVAVAEEISNQMDTWNDTVIDGVTQVLASNKLNAEISFSSEKLETQKDENSNPVAPAENILSATDANGNTVIKTEKGYITLDKDGNKIQEVYTADDGTVITLKFDENEKVIQAVHARTDGTVVTESYDQNGVLTKEIRESSSGKSTLRTETEYYTNGNIKSSYTYDHSDSSHFEVRYYENGIKSYEYNFYGDSQYTERTYDDKGNRLTENSKEADGTRWELTYNPDGSHYGYTYYPDGSVWYNEWDANDNQDLSAQKQIK